MGILTSDKGIHLRTAPIEPIPIQKSTAIPGKHCYKCGRPIKKDGSKHKEPMFGTAEICILCLDERRKLTVWRSKHGK